MRPEELEAIVAHELAHVRRRDVLVQTFVVLFAATLVESSRIGGWFSRVLLYVFAPIAAAFVHVLLSSKRELAADELAARTPALHTTSPTRYSASTGHPSSSHSPHLPRPSPSTRSTFEDEGVARMFKTHLRSSTASTGFAARRRPKRAQNTDVRVAQRS